MSLSRSLLALVALCLAAACSSDGDAVPAGESSPTVSPSAAPTTSSTVAAMTPGVDRLAYQANNDPTQVRIVGIDGSGDSWPAADAPGTFQTNPDWSPDGTRIVYALSLDDHDSLWVSNVDGSGSKQLAECAGQCLVFDDPAWSPDGTKVIYQRTSFDGQQTDASIETVDVVDGTITVLLQAPDAQHFFAGTRYSPDGSQVVYEYVHKVGDGPSDEVDGVELDVFDVASPQTTIRTIVPDGTFPATADWGPHGDSIVFSALPEPGAATPDIFTVLPDGTGLTRVTDLADSGGSGEEPAWSVDGKSIYFVAWVPAESLQGIAVVPATGGEVTPLWGDTFLSGRHPRPTTPART